MDIITKRSTVYLYPEVHKALKLKSAQADISVSKLINDAVREQLSEDADDLLQFDSRKDEESISFESFVKRLKKSGKI